jgi:hypothetical protein
MYSMGRTTMRSAIEAMFAQRTMDFAFGARLPAILQEHGLEAMAFENDAPMVPGGSAFAKMMGMSANQLRDKYIATRSATDQGVEQYGAFTADPSCWATYHGTVRAIGRKPFVEGSVQPDSQRRAAPAAESQHHWRGT